MPSPLDGKRIAYVPYSADLKGPGDRRRFVRYAALKRLAFEKPQPGVEYDVVVLSSLADLTAWHRLPRTKTRLVYELVDSYLDINPLEPRALARGVAKYLLRQHRHLELSYHASLRRMFRRADAVICSTPEQHRKIAADNPNTHAILDFHSGELGRAKTDYALGPTVRLLWEGLPGNLITFEAIAEVLRALGRRRDLRLDLVTNPTYPLGSGPLPELNTRRLVDRYLRGLAYDITPWSPQALTEAARRADLAVIPMIRKPIYWAKPENKLLLLWRLGVPVLAAATPAYTRVMHDAGVDMICSTEADWASHLERALSDAQLRGESVEKGHRYLDRENSEEVLVAKWDAVFRSIG